MSINDPRSIPCPRCGAAVGEPCYYDRHMGWKLKMGDEMPLEHQERWQAIMRFAQEKVA